MHTVIEEIPRIRLNICNICGHSWQTDALSGTLIYDSNPCSHQLSLQRMLDEKVYGL